MVLSQDLNNVCGEGVAHGYPGHRNSLLTDTQNPSASHRELEFNGRDRKFQ
jgi:hypothetical protein